MTIQQTCAILDDCQRLHYRLLFLRSYSIDNIFLHKGQVGVIVRMLYLDLPYELDSHIFRTLY